MFSKRILFTYTSPYINNCIDIRDRLRLHHIDESDAETLLRKEHLSDPSLEEHVKKVLNEELLTFHVFSTFLYPQLGKLRRIDNGETKKKLRKWCENAAIFQRRCVFFPLFQQFVLMR